MKRIQISIAKSDRNRSACCGVVIKEVSVDNNVLLIERTYSHTDKTGQAALLMALLSVGEEFALKHEHVTISTEQSIIQMLRKRQKEVRLGKKSTLRHPDLCKAILDAYPEAVLFTEFSSKKTTADEQTAKRLAQDAFSDLKNQP